MNNAPQLSPKYVRKDPLNENEIGMVTSTKLALMFLYEDALRNRHHAMVEILRNTLERFNQIAED